MSETEHKDTRQIWLVSVGGDYDGTSVIAAYESRENAIDHAEEIEIESPRYTTGEVNRYDRDDGSILIRHEPESIVEVEPVEVYP